MARGCQPVAPQRVLSCAVRKPSVTKSVSKCHAKSINKQKNKLEDKRNGYLRKSVHIRRSQKPCPFISQTSIDLAPTLFWGAPERSLPVLPEGANQRADKTSGFLLTPGIVKLSVNVGVNQAIEIGSALLQEFAKRRRRMFVCRDILLLPY